MAANVTALLTIKERGGARGRRGYGRSRRRGEGGKVNVRELGKLRGEKQRETDREIRTHSEMKGRKMKGTLTTR